MPQNAFLLRTRDLLVSQKTTQRHFFPSLSPLSTIIFATATVLAFVRLRNSRFNFHCYTQREEIGPELRRDLSRLLARKITKRIHSSKPASLNRPICTAFGTRPIQAMLELSILLLLHLFRLPSIDSSAKQECSVLK